jgi:hypothetical protein
MKYGLLAIFLVGIWSCSDDDPVDSSGLNGKWIEVKTKTDTVSFEAFEDKKYMMLRRGKLLRSGPYEYVLLPDDRISIHWTLAATMTFQEYPFKMSGDKFDIGNFFESPSGEILTFQKLK